MDMVIGALGGMAALFGALVALDLAAMRWGVDSRSPDVGRALYERWWQDQN